MTHTDIRSALAELSAIASDLESIYLENGGEVTEETTSMEDRLSVIRELLTTEGVDDLGRWLKAKEDEKATYKAEKAAAEAKIKSIDKTIDFVKDIIGQVLRSTGHEKIKGSFYTFSQYTSTKTTVKTDVLDEMFMWKLDMILKEAELPGFISLAIKTTATEIKKWAEEHDGQGLLFIEETSTETCKFTKPRKAKEETA